MILMTPAGASAQFNDVLRNVMQNMLQVPQPGYQAYPPFRQPAYPYGAGVPAPAVSDSGTIAELQRMLDDLGYNAGPADGGWGPQSAQALNNFGRDHGLATSEISAASLNAVRSVWYERNRAPGSVPAGVDQRISRPSFDCARAVAPSARTICGNASLAELDAEMAAAYVAARAGLPAEEQAKVATAQREWLRRRNACGADASCLERALTERLGQLQTSAGTAGIGAFTAAPAVRDLPPAFAAPDSRAAIVAADQSGDAAAAIERLSHPQTGLRALKFPMLEGLPVFVPDFVTGGNEAEFFKLVALGARPNLIESNDEADYAHQFANEFLTSPNKYLAKFGNYWAGGNEFQRNASRRAFLRDYAEKLRQMAPKPPFEFVYATELTLGRYDVKLGGFPLKGAPNLRSLPYGWLQPSPNFEWPELLLPIDEAGAQRLLDQLEAARTAKMGDPRAVRLAAVIVAKGFDPGSLELQLDLRRLTLYNDDLTQSLYEFPVPAASHRPAPDIVSRLLAPPPGVMPIRLPTFEGRPILRPDVVSENFLALAAVGEFPDLLIERKGVDSMSIDGLKMSLAQQFLTPDLQRQFLNNPNLSNSGWKGVDEFARARSRQGFEQNYLPSLKEWAPKGPFEFVSLKMVQLPEYDPKRGGFALGKGGIKDEFPDGFGLIATMGTKWTPQFEPPDLFWRLDAPTAERLLHQLEQAAARQKAFGNSANYRMVQVVSIVEASRLRTRPGPHGPAAKGRSTLHPRSKD